jgi:putative transcriptional regulator
MVKLRLSELLKEKGRTAYWLAKETRMSQGVVWNMVSGKTRAIHFETVSRICEALDCTPADLFDHQA